MVPNAELPAVSKPHHQNPSATPAAVAGFAEHSKLSGVGGAEGLVELQRDDGDLEGGMFGGFGKGSQGRKNEKKAAQNAAAPNGAEKHAVESPPRHPR